MAQGKDKASSEAESFEPKGTLLIVFIFFVLLVILWGSVYLTLVSRGVTV